MYRYIGKYDAEDFWQCNGIIFKMWWIINQIIELLEVSKYV